MKQTLITYKTCTHHAIGTINSKQENDIFFSDLEATETSMLKFWIHLQGLPENNIAKQCLQLSKEMADKNQIGLRQKVDQLCIKYNSSPITLKKLFTSHIKQNIRKR